MKINNDYKYYDFWLGFPSSHCATWLHFPIKHFGLSPLDAALRYQRTNKVYNNSKLYNIRRIHEFTLVKKSGLTVYQFKFKCSYDVEIKKKEIVFLVDGNSYLDPYKQFRR